MSRRITIAGAVLALSLAGASIASGQTASGVIRLIERNCAIHRVSSEHAAACQAELDLFREVLGTDVERESHIAAGDRCCSYRIGAGTGTED